MRRLFFVFFIFGCFIPLLSLAQQVEQAANYISDLDQTLTVRRVAILPVTDNLEGIYARPLEGRLKELIKDSHRWDFVETKVVGQLLTPADLENDPGQVLKLAEGSGADALFAARASRGPNGVTITIDMFSAKDGKLLLQEIIRDYPQYETKELTQQIETLYRKLVSKMPYSGLVLSRKGNRVTVNLGKKDGIVANTVVTAILIIKANRHPKFNFLISTEREVLGKIKIEKVDDLIGFGVVVSEKSRGAIEKNTKLTGLDFVKYEDPAGYTTMAKDGLDPNDEANKLSFGAGAKEWVPVAPPTFGKVGLLLGLGSYNYNMQVEGIGSLKGSSSLFPSIRIDGELWLTPVWNVVAQLRQGVLAVGNPRSNSTPAELNVSLSKMSLYGAYNFLLKDDFFGPKIQVLAGFVKYSSFVDASSPLSLTSQSYSGLAFGLKGELPVTDDESWVVGAGAEVFIFGSSYQESPASSGAETKNTINSFSLFGNYKLTPKIRVVGSLEFEQYSSTFSGSGTRAEQASNSSQRSTLLLGGINYLF